jgi:O-antigen ligase
MHNLQAYRAQFNEGPLNLSFPQRGLLGTFVGFLITILFLSGNFSISIFGVLAEVRVFILIFVFLGMAAISSLGVKLRLPKLPFEFAFGWFILFFLSISSLWSFNIDQASIELINVLFMLLISILALIVFHNFPGAIKSALVTLLTFSLLYSLAALITSVMSGGRGSILLGGPNVATRVMFFGIISILALTSGRKDKKLLLFIPVILAGIVAIGSRGGMLGAFLALGFFLMISILRSRLSVSTISAKKFFAFSISVLLFSQYLFPLVYEVFESRVINLMVNRIHLAGRDSLYEGAWELIKVRPLLGYGLGGYYGDFLSFYPHNIALQLWMDGGLILVVCLASMVIVSIRCIIYKRGMVSILAIAMLYMLVVQQFSGGYYDFRYYFFFLCMLTALKYQRITS